MSDIAPPENHSGPSENKVPNALAPLLVKIAALAGVAVPLHRFATPVLSSGGLELSNLDPSNQAIELWKIRFSDGQADLLETSEISKSDLPLLWLSNKEESLNCH